jgi:hypothetical protein
MLIHYGQTFTTSEELRQKYKEDRRSAIQELISEVEKVGNIGGVIKGIFRV